MAYLAQCAPESIPMILVEGAIEDQVTCLQSLGALAEVSLVKHDLSLLKISTGLREAGDFREPAVPSRSW
jgi:hypothetical protein